MQVVVNLIEPLSNTSFLAHALVEALVSVSRYQSHLFGTRGSYQPKLRKSKSSISDFSPSVNHYHDDNEEHRLLPSTSAMTGEISSSTISTIAAVGLQHKCVQVQRAIFVWGEFQPLSERWRQSSTHFRKSFPVEDTEQNNFTLVIDHLEASRGECIFLLGNPGSGKSSVLLALLGEMTKVDGYSFVARVDRIEESSKQKQSWKNRRTKTSTSVSFVSQPPWIPEGTVRSVILFGRQYNPVRYKKAIEACDLETVS